MATTDQKKEETKKERRPQAKKREIQNEKRRLRNKAVRTRVRTGIRSFEEARSKGDQAAVQSALNEVYSLVDKASKSGVFKANKASRIKSRLAAKAIV